MKNAVQILFEDPLFLVVNKPAGVPLQPDATADRSLLEYLSARFRQQLHPVHRIDRPVSGVVLLARSKEAMTELTRQMQARTIEKEYLAIVENRPPEAAGTLVHYIRKHPKTNRSLATLESAPGAERAELQYNLISETDRYVVLGLQLITGRHHQIRAQLSAIGCAVKGDVKYGARRGNPDRSIHLHAWKLAFKHPLSGESLLFYAPLFPDCACGPECTVATCALRWLKGA